MEEYSKNNLLTIICYSFDYFEVIKCKYLQTNVGLAGLSKHILHSLNNCVMHFVQQRAAGVLVGTAAAR